MKKVLAAIGGFFAKIWRWIVETAWIQPLLIVGIIFGVIFSIPSISSWINEESETKGQYAFYNKNKIKATELLKCYEEDDFSSLLEKNGADRGLLVFIEKDCDMCIKQEAAFKLFSKEEIWNYDGNQDVAPAINFVYVYDIKEDTDDTQANAFRKLIEEEDLDWFIHDAYRNTQNDKLGINPSDSDWVGEDAGVPIPTPTIAYYTADGVTNALLGLDGASSAEQANFLRDFYYGINDWEI